VGCTVISVTTAPPVAERPEASLRTLNRWLTPQRLRGWTDTVPERYWLGLPLAPRVLFTCSPADIRAIFAERDGVLQFGEGMLRLAPHEPMFGHEAMKRLDGEDHVRVRRQLTSAFHGDALKGYERRIVEITERHMTGWPINQPVRFFDLSRLLVRDIIAAVIFGVTEPDRTRRLLAVLDRLEDAVNSTQMTARMLVAIMLRGRWAPYGEMERVHAEIEEITREEIADRRAEHARRAQLVGGGAGLAWGDDCLDRFLELDGSADVFSDDEIVMGMRVLLVAGWATSYNTIAWLAERLAHNPAALARCHAELDAGAGVGAGGGGRYLMAAIHEAMRMRPAVPYTVRYVSEDFNLNGLSLKRGTLIALDIERMHFRRDIYPDPDVFAPERFLENRPGTHTWIPFGGGMHRCIGAGFALTEARLVLSTVLGSLTFATEPSNGEPSRRTALITVPADGARLTLRRRAASVGRGHRS
jgi:cytochrome P450 family 135